MSEQIIWEDPPEAALAAARGRGHYAEFAKQLRSRPNAWAVLPGVKSSPDSAKGTAGNIRTGKMKDFTKGEFEVVVDNTKIYVRFIGAAATDPAPEPAEQNLPVEDSSGPGANGWEAARVRLWASSNGFNPPDKGRLSGEIWEAYAAAHGGSAS